MNYRNALVWTVIGAMALTVGALGAPRYVDGIDAAFPPFSFIDDNGVPAGFDVDVVRWIADEMGFEVEIVPVDWDAIIPTLLVGNIDFIASGMTITQARKERVSFTEPYWQVDLAVVVRQETQSDGEQQAEFNVFTAVQPGRRIGVQRGTTSQDWLEDEVLAAGIGINIVLYDNFLLALEDLLIGRIDAAVMDEPTALSSIADRPLTVVGTIATGEIYGYAVRQGDTELLNTLNEGLSRIQSDPMWDQLVAKWLVGR